MRRNITEPFPKECMGSKCFRIPAMLTTKEGALLAVCDARWNHGLDAAGNLETVAALSIDGAESWERQFVNHFEDVKDGSDRCIFSAGFIDPVVAQDDRGNLYLLADLCPAFVGVWGEGIVCGQQSGRHANGRLALKDLETYTCGETVELNEETYPYYAGEPGEDGYLPVLRIRDGQPYKGYVLDDEWYLYKRQNGSLEKVMITQLDGEGRKTSHMVHANVFFAAAPIKVYPAFHIVCRISRDGGRTWGKMQDVSSQIGSRGFTAVCPGRGYCCQYEGKERVLIPIYDNNLGTEFSGVIFTEDQGETWRRGQRAKETGYREDGSLVKSSESQIVELPDKTLRMYSRSMVQEIIYADSKDGGETWSAYSRESGLGYCGNCMISVINYSRRIDGMPVLVASYPGGDKEPYHRVNGIIAVGLVGENGKVDWKYHYSVNQGPFYYSCLTELPNGDIALWYEYEEYAIELKVYSLEELIGN